MIFKILILNNNSNDNEYFSTIFNSEEYDLSICNFDNCFIEKIISGEFYLIIINSESFEIKFFEIVKSLKSNTLIKEIPILLTINEITQKDKTALYNLGIDDIIYKPLSEKEITKKIKTLLSLKFNKEHLNYLIDENIKIEKEYIKLSIAVEQSPNAIVITDLNGDIEYVNSAFEKITGYDKNEVYGKNPRILKSGYQKNDFYKNLWEQISSGEKWTGEFKNRKKNGELYWERASITPIVARDGLIFRYIAIKEDITSEKKAKERIEENEKKYKAIYEGANEGIVTINLNTNKIEFVNPVFKKMFLLATDNQIIGKKIDFIIPKNQKTSFNKKFNIATHNYTFQLEKIKCINTKNEILICDIKTTHIEISETPFLLALFSDITERIEYEEKILQSEEKYRNLFNNSQMGIGITKMDGTIVEVNNSISQIYGYTKEEFLQLNIKDLYCSSKDRILLLRELNHKKYIKNREISFLKKDKSIIHTVLSLSKLIIQGETHYLASLVDITKRKKVEIELQQSEKRYRKLFENAQLGIAITTLNGKIIDANKAIENITGFNYSDSINNNVIQLYVYKEERKKMLTEILKNGYVYNYETELYKKNGDIFYANINSNILELNEQKYLLTTILDITNTKNYEKQLEQEKEKAEYANLSKSRFLANISHEIRTPLNAVIGFTDILSNIEKDESKTNYLKSIKSASNNLLNLINDILDMSKIEAGKMKIQKNQVDLRTIIYEIKEIFSLKTRQKNLDFFINISDELPEYIMFDELRIRQVFLNLVGNAVKFTHKGFVKINIDYQILKEKKAILKIEIIDTGIGIKKEATKTIFEAFQQTDAQDARKYEGTGLGLAISKRLVELMNGKILLDSELGKGSKFSLIFENIEKCTNFLKFDTEKEENINYKFKSALILIIDDIESNRNIISKYLHDANFKVIEAENGKNGLFLAKQYKPNLIITDLKMPEIDGFQFIKLIRQEEKLRRIPIFAISAMSLSSEQEKNVNSKFDEFIPKPIRKNILFEKLIKYLPIENNENYKENISANYEIKNPEKIAEIVEIMEKIYENEWKNISKSQDISLIEEFATKINEIGKKYRIKLIEKFGTNLFLFCQNIDIDNINLTLLNFKEIINDLKILQNQISNENN